MMYELTTEMQQRLKERFTYHAPRHDQSPRYERIRDHAHEFAKMVCMFTPPGRDQSLALTAIEDAVMRANAAIAVGEIAD